MICAGTLLREDWKPFGRRKASFLCERMDGNEVAGSILFLSCMDAYSVCTAESWDRQQRKRRFGREESGGKKLGRDRTKKGKAGCMKRIQQGLFETVTRNAMSAVGRLVRAGSEDLEITTKSHRMGGRLIRSPLSFRLILSSRGSYLHQWTGYRRPVRQCVGKTIANEPEKQKVF